MKENQELKKRKNNDTDKLCRIEKETIDNETKIFAKIFG